MFGQTIVKILAMSNSLKIDFGSGYNPEPDYKTCDFVPLPTLDFWYDEEHNIIVDLQPGSVDVFRLKNVLHHIPNMTKICTLLWTYLRVGGIVIVIEPSPEAYGINYLLDCVYYRFVNYKPEIWFSKDYRKYTGCFTSNHFTCISQEILDDVYIKTVFRKEG